MQSTQTRRRLLATLSSAMAAGVIGDARVSAQEAPPETTTIRLAKIPGICVAPQYVAEELLRTVCFAQDRHQHGLRGAVPHSGGLGLAYRDNSLCDACGVDLPGRRLGGARGPADHGPDGSRPSATVRNSARSGQLVGSWMRMRAMCSITRAPILIRRSRMVANSQPASGLVRGIAARTPCTSQNAAV